MCVCAAPVLKRWCCLQVMTIKPVEEVQQVPLPPVATVAVHEQAQQLATSSDVLSDMLAPMTNAVGTIPTQPMMLPQLVLEPAMVSGIAVLMSADQAKALVHHLMSSLEMFGYPRQQFMIGY